MSDFQLPDELTHIERILFSSSLGEPPASLRHRVQQSIHYGEQTTAAAQKHSASAWNFCVGLAAAIAVWANLSSSALNHGVSIAAPPASPNIDRQAELLHDLAPGLTREEARRQLVVLAAGLRWSEQRFRPTIIQPAARREG